MSYLEYEKAQKLGLKAYKSAVQKGKHPYLPVLDDILSVVDIKGEMNLGLVQVPLDRVVGTSTVGRTYSFANNFMPILNYKTEFGTKWASLCDAHMEEGIRDPIKVYEYLNYYYVVEGNKRVSVLKYFDAVSVPAYVTRKVPKLTDDPEIKIYYEFMDFYKVTGVNFLWVSKEGGFNELLEATGTNDKEKWDENDIKDFSSFYYMFSSAYDAKGGKKLNQLTTGDALLIFLKIYGYEKAKEMGSDEMKSSIAKIWQEFFVINERNSVDLNMNPPTEEGAKKNLLGYLLNGQQQSTKPLKVAFIYDRDPMTSDWLYAHELGRNHIKEVFGEKVSTLKIATARTEEQAIEAMEDLINNQGTEVIFTTTSRLISASLKVAVKYPNVKILNCSLNTSHRYIRTYYARLYEAKFLSGMIAGTLTKSDKIGYLADYPIYGTPANINAFALGAKMVNPDVKVYLWWTTLKTGATRDDIYKAYYEEGVDFISDQDMITPKSASRRYGVYKLTEDGSVNVTVPVHNWGVLYEKIIKMIQAGKWNQTATDDPTKAINYWWGLSSGVIDLIISKKVPVEVLRLVNTFKQLIIEEKFFPFEGEIHSQSGEIKNEQGEKMAPEDIMKMDWLVDNVIGTIPVINELKERARPIVELKGVLNNEDENSSTR